MNKYAEAAETCTKLWWDVNICGQRNLVESVSNANSHFRYWHYRRSIGNPISLRVAYRQWIARVLFEWLGIGSGS